MSTKKHAKKKRVKQMPSLVAVPKNRKSWSLVSLE